MFLLVPLSVDIRNPLQPASETRVRSEFFPAEAARILGLRRVDYRQLRRLFDLVASPDRSAATLGKGRRWARFSFRDLLAAKLALFLARRRGGRGDRPRLQLQDVEASVRALTRYEGIASPLLEARWGIFGSTLIAEVDGIAMEPRTRQTLFGEVVQGATEYVRELRRARRTDVAQLRRLLEREVSRVRLPSRRRG